MLKLDMPRETHRKPKQQKLFVNSGWFFPSHFSSRDVDRDYPHVLFTHPISSKQQRSNHPTLMTQIRTQALKAAEEALQIFRHLRYGKGAARSAKDPMAKLKGMTPSFSLVDI